MIHSTIFGVELMRKENRNSSTDAVIINIASSVGLDPFHLLPIYTASKHAIVGFSRAYSVSYPIGFVFIQFSQKTYKLQHESYASRNGVKIIILCPGATTTSFVRQFSGNMIFPNENDALTFFRSVPMQR